jgi:hypothetical protein
MTVPQLIEFIQKGGLPVAFPRKYQDVAAAWHHVHQIPMNVFFKRRKAQVRQKREFLLTRSG